MARTWAGRLGPTPPTPDDDRPPLWRLILRRPADTRTQRTALYHRLHELAADVERLAEQVGALENDRGGDTPLGYHLGEIADELDGLSHG